jgi:uncharacterized membrane protein
MSKGLRAALWILSSLGVLWTIVAITGLFTAGMRGCPGCAAMMRSGGMMGGSSMMMGGMMAQMILTWIVMLGLDALFVYLLVTSRRRPRLIEGSQA